LRDSDIAIGGLSWIEREAAMANPTGESESDAVRLDFDRRLMLQFRGSVVTSDAGLIAIANSMMRWGYRRWRAMFSPTHALARMAGTHWPDCFGNRSSAASPDTRT
jgi:hypothetical protein